MSRQSPGGLGQNCEVRKGCVSFQCPTPGSESQNPSPHSLYRALAQTKGTLPPVLSEVSSPLGIFGVLLGVTGDFRSTALCVKQL